MTTDNITRVRYFEKQFLRTKDFATEQAYHIAMRRRHNIAQHYWGIVHGLELAVDEGGLFVQPGMAVDGYGRELVLGMRKPLSLDEFSTKARDDLDVWLVYTRRSSDRAPEGYNSCDQTAGAEYYRWQEEPLVRLSKPEAGGTRPREPESVPREVLNNIGPHLTPPDDPQQQWPVYLGRILRDNSDPENPVYSVDLANRPYAGLVGEAIKAPSGRAAVFLGDEVVAATDENSAAVQSSRFSVVLSDDECSEREALRIDACGEITVKGKASVHGDVQVEGGAVEFKVGESTSAVESCNASPTSGPGSSPRPWRMYRYKCKDATTSDEVEQLRIEMSPQFGEKGEVVIGAWSPDEERFKPVLSVSNDNKVTVHGDLIVQGQTTGQITSSLSTLARKMTPEAENFLLGSYAGGIGGANLQIGKFYHSPFGEAVDLNTPEGIKNAIDYISADSARLDALVDVLFDNPVASQAFVEKLMGEDSGRRLVMDQLVTNPSARNGFSALLQENVYSDVLDPFALNIVATSDGREAIMNGLVSSSSELATFADLLTDARYTDRADEFAGAVSKTNEGREGFMQALTAASAELTSFTQLLTNATYFDRLPRFAESIMATETGRRSTIEDGMPLNSTQLQNFAELLRDFYSDWLTQILDQIKLTDPGADAIANNLLATGSGRGAAVRDLMADVVRLQDMVNRILDEQLGRKATADSFEGLDAGDAAANTRRDLFSNLDWLLLGSDATAADWTASYNRFATITRPRFC